MGIKTIFAAIAVSTLSFGVAQAQDATYGSFWDGLFAGAHVGYGWTGTNVSRVGSGIDFSVGSNPSGFLGGVQVGYNYKHNNLVFGVIGDISAVDMSDTAGFFGPRVSLAWKTDYDYLATIRGRAGYLWDDKVLLYLHGGVAFTDVKTTFGGFGAISGTTLGGSETGYVIGAGAEATVREFRSALDVSLELRQGPVAKPPRHVSTPSAHPRPPALSAFG